jgi:hypothetical protein
MGAITNGTTLTGTPRRGLIVLCERAAGAIFDVLDLDRNGVR